MKMFFFISLLTFCFELFTSDLYKDYRSTISITSKIPVDDTKVLQAKFDNGGVINLENRIYRVTRPLVIKKSNTVINGNNALVEFLYEQNRKSPTFFESLFVVKDKDNVEFHNIKLKYLGTFNLGTYGGMVSGIYVTGASNFLAEKVEASNFNRAGINLGGGEVAYNRDPVLKNCFLHHNRVAGCLYGNNFNGKIENNRFNNNGLIGDNGTGYGFTGWSASLPKNTFLRNNVANNNVRKGIDFHSGISGIIENNICEGNFVSGIFVQNVTGKWIIRSNQIGKMSFSKSKVSRSMYAIEVGNRDRNGNRSENIHFEILHNTIEQFSGEIGKVSIPIMIYVNNIGQGNIVIKGNILNVGTVTNFLLASNAGNRNFSNYYDVDIIGNSFSATRVISIPFYLRGDKNRNVNFLDNKLSIGELIEKKRYILFNDKPATFGGKVKFNNNELTINGSAAVGPIELLPKRVNASSVINNLMNNLK